MDGYEKQKMQDFNDSQAMRGWIRFIMGDMERVVFFMEWDVHDRSWMEVENQVER